MEDYIIIIDIDNTITLSKFKFDSSGEEEIYDAFFKYNKHLMIGFEINNDVNPERYDYDIILYGKPATLLSIREELDASGVEHYTIYFDYDSFLNKNHLYKKE